LIENDAVDDPKSRPSLADDPTFLASLSELDRGLTDRDVDAPAERAPVHPARSSPSAAPSRAPIAAPPSAQSPQRPAPTQPPAPTRPPAQRDVPPAAPRKQPPRPAAIAPFPAPAAVPPPGEPAARRPLIDLFPPEAFEVERPPDSMQGVSPAPRLPRARPARVKAATPPEELTYETFYGLHEKPFSASPDPRFLYHSVAHDHAVQTLLDAIHRRDELIVVAGEAGVGKTMVCRAVVDQVDRRTATSFLGAPFVSADDLLETMLADFGAISKEDLARGRLAPLATKTRAELTETLRSFVEALAERQASAVVVVDDAQELPVDVLEQLSVLPGFDGASHVLQAIFAGRPEFLETLALPQLKALAGRVALRCDLGPLKADEIAGYVRDHLAVAGTSARVEFDDGALRRAFELSAGNPRLLNVLCDRALELGRERSASVIDVDLIEAAAAESEIAPAETEARGLLRFVAGAVVLTVLMLVGAMAAAFVFREQLSRVIVQWQAIPEPPGGPVPRLPVPLTPIPEPPA
jgi:general secretion pathway protein A